MDDHRQDDNAGHDRYNVSNSRGGQRDQQRERRLRPVSSGAEGVQSKDGKASHRPQLLFRYFRRTQRLAEK